MREETRNALSEWVAGVRDGEIDAPLPFAEFLAAVIGEPTVIDSFTVLFGEVPVVEINGDHFLLGVTADALFESIVHAAQLVGVDPDELIEAAEEWSQRMFEPMPTLAEYLGATC